MAGLGRRNLRIVATDSNLKMNVDDLEASASPRIARTASAFHGDRHRGHHGCRRHRSAAGDRALLQRAGLWFHADAAYGGAALSRRASGRISPALKRGLHHLRRAQVALGSHGLRNVLLPPSRERCPGVPRRCHLHAQPSRGEDARRPSIRSRIRRSGRGASSGSSFLWRWRSTARQATPEMIDHQARMGDVLREALARPAGASSIPRRCRWSALRAMELFRQLLLRMRERQIAWMSEAELGGVPVMRACITSFKTTEKDIEWVVKRDEQPGIGMRRRRDREAAWSQVAIVEGRMDL
jgi:aromatic-L-amino-acid decarboxylase